MKPIKFYGHNKVWAENQQPYQPLPAYTDERLTISCWQLTWREVFSLLWTRRLWLLQMNFGAPLQPQLPSVKCPFAYNIGA